ncbi:YraN family protein [Microbulbifer discodermiae]|uniref:YraN family protein n=1 Tax=Microbulbifer sp. 2201CG32-9 TaxID=3232309 RepID=UPI00345C3F2A
MAAAGGTGAAMEAVAARYLTETGLSIAARNYRCPGGEIDIVAWDGNTLVFVEVRYRRSDAFGCASASIDRRKQQKLHTAAADYLQRHKVDCPCRFDVVAIDGGIDNIRWIPHAFEARG